MRYSEFNNFNSLNSSVLDSECDTFKYGDFKCSGNINLEPRLIQYIDMKKYYKNNGIEPSISLESQYSITDEDKDLIKRFVKGDKNIYKKKSKANRSNVGETFKPSFPSSKMGKDKRMAKFNYFKKETFDNPLNLGMFAPDKGEKYYDMPYDPSQEYFDSRNFTDNYEYSRFDPRADSKINPGELDVKNTKYDLKRIYKNDSNNNINNQILNNKISQDMLGAVPNPYRSRSGNPVNFSQQQQKPMLTGSENIYGQKNMNKNINDFDDCDEIDMMLGIPQHTSKSYGYRNPEEHYYSYIDPNFQNAENTTSMPYHSFGEPTRLNNKKYNKKYIREMM